MRFSKSVLAISIALAVSGVAGAATKSNEDDSVHEWGRWAVLMPAAGPEAGPDVAVIPAGNDLGSCESSENCPKIVSNSVEPPQPPPPPPPPVVEGHCQAGASCGYATYEYSYSTYNSGGYGEDSSTSGHGARVPANIDLNVQFTQVEEVQAAAIDTPPADNGDQAATADFTVDPTEPHDNYPPVTDHTEGSVTDNGDGTLQWDTSSYTYSNTGPDGGEGSSSTNAGINGGMAPALTEDTAAGDWYDGAEGYGYNYNDGYSYYSESSRSQGNYVAGTATNMAFLDSLNAGNVQADYTGFAMQSGVPVAIHVNFGNDTWRGAWNNGQDGSVSVDTDENGVKHVEGQVGFRASGYLSGPNIVSNRLSADDATKVTGRVDGSFFGSHAQVLGGVGDITKTVTANTVHEGGTTYNAARNADVFVTVEKSIADQHNNIFRNRAD
ncbi:MAG: hypothetical protein HZB57_06725 [Gammaproteobacteria bacterium]|nr:hypothetical protein [Gammaproteobacteria bacterium]